MLLALRSLYESTTSVSLSTPTVDLLPSSDSGQSTIDNVTNQSAPVFRLSFSAAVSGAVATLYDGGIVTNSATLGPTEVTNGFVDLQSGPLTDGNHSITATLSSGTVVTPFSTALPVLVATTAPQVTSVVANASQITISYANSIGLDPANIAPTSAYSATVGGAGRQVTGVTVNSALKTVTVSLISPIQNASETVALVYSKGATADQINAIQDIAGNDAPSFADNNVVNITGDNIAPSAPTLALTAASDTGASSADLLTSLVTPTFRITFNGSGPLAPRAGDTAKILYLGGVVAQQPLSSGNVAQGYIELTTSNLGGDGAKAITAIVTDAAGNVSSPSNTVNITVDTSVFAVSSASVNGATVSLVMSRPIDSAHLPPTGSFTILSNGNTIPVTAVSAVNNVMLLTLQAGVSAGQSVQFSYSPVFGQNPLQSISGVDALAYNALSVTNLTPGGLLPTPGIIAAPSASNEPLVVPGLLPVTGTGQNLDTTVVNSALGLGHRESVTIGDPSVPGSFARVIDHCPADNDFGITVRQIPCKPRFANPPNRITLGTTVVRVLPEEAQRKKLRITNVGRTVLYVGVGGHVDATIYHLALKPCDSAFDDGTGGTVDLDGVTHEIYMVSSASNGQTVILSLS